MIFFVFGQCICSLKLLNDTKLMIDDKLLFQMRREADFDVELIYHRLTVANRTVISSGLPPSVSIPAARAFTENGDKN